MKGAGILLAAASMLAFGQPQTDPPFVLPEGVELQRDVVYASVGQRELHVDLFLPKRGAGRFPAVVYVHGGGWSGGNRTQFHRQAAHMASRGYVGACVEYRLSGEAKYPAAIHDVKAAIRFLRANATRYRLDPARIGAAGGSAGGHLAALAGVTGDNAAYDSPDGAQGVSSAVQAVAAFNPAVDISGFGQSANPAATKALTAFFGKTFADVPKLYSAASPLDQVNSKAPPFLFLHGTADTTVPYKQSTDMVEALKKAGVRAEIFTAEGAAHGFFNRPPWYEPTLQRMERFFDETLRHKEKNK